MNGRFCHKWEGWHYPKSFEARPLSRCVHTQRVSVTTERPARPDRGPGGKRGPTLCPMCGVDGVHDRRDGSSARGDIR